MPIVISELVSHHLYHISLEASPDLSEVETLLHDYQAMLDAATVPLVHFIVNLEHGKHHPHLGEVYRCLNPFLSQAKLGWFVVYGNPDKLLAFMFSVIASMFKLRLHYVQDYAEALKFIQATDLTLGRWGAELVPEPQIYREELA